MARLWIVLTALAALFGGALWWLHAPPAERGAAVTDAQPLRHVGAQACMRCHEEPFRDWWGSQHQRAMQPARPELVLAPFAGERFAGAGVDATFLRKDGRFLVRTQGQTGETQEFEVSHTLGVAPLQQYLIPMPDGGLQALDIAWDSRSTEEGGQRWFHLQGAHPPKPGDELHWTGLQNNWNFMCADCHTTDFKKGFDPQTRRYASRWAELGVSCESCHGPGSAHIAWAESGPPRLADGSKGLSVQLNDRRGVIWRIDPGSGNARRSEPPTRARPELEVCARCHSHRSQFSDDSWSGKPLLDSHLPSLLQPSLFWPDGQARAEVYNHASFLQSKMASQGVTCSDCHQPHSQRLRAPGNAVCLQCHASGRFERVEHHRHALDSKGAQCVACHMPPSRFMQIDPRHDHAIRVPRPDLSQRMGTPNACNQCHSDQTTDWAARWALRWYPDLSRRAMPLAEALHASEGGAPESLQRLLELLASPERPAIERATALSRLPPAAVPAERLTAALADADALLRHSAVEMLSGADAAERAQRLTPLLDDPVKAVRLAAARGLAGAPAARLNSTARTRLQAVLVEYIAAQRYNADRPEAYNNLGTLHTELGDWAAAETALQQALALAPGHASTMLNLADLYRASGRESEAQALLAALVQRQPDHATAWHALGLSLLRLQRLDEALPALRRAAELDPVNPRNAYVHAIALEAAGQGREAIKVLELALRRHPQNPELAQALRDFGRKWGERERVPGPGGSMGSGPERRR